MILLAQPSYNGVADGTSTDRQRLIHPPGELCEPCSIVGTNIVEARARIADIALEHPGVTHVLWTDADMRFPADSLLRLLGHGLEIVGANYRRRSPPHRWSARINGEPVVPGEGLQQVHCIGFGVVLTDINVLRRTIELQGDPLFLWPWCGRVRGNAVYQSDDYYFCDKARAAGFAIYVDHELSRECRHITTTELEYEA